MKRGADLKEEWKTFVTDGDAAAYYALYAHYHDYFFYLGIKKGALAESIKDHINDLFLYVFESRASLTEVQDHHNYLVTSFIRRLFKSHHFSAAQSDEMAALENTYTSPPADSQFISDDLNEQVSKILKKEITKLTKSQARMIQERFFQGLEYEEIAASHGISVKTTYNTIYGALHTLRKTLGEEKVTALTLAISSLSILIYLFFKNP